MGKEDQKEELYILSKGGSILYYFSTHQTVDHDEKRLLTASYLTAVLQFAEAASGNVISSFELGKIRIILKPVKEPSMTFVYILDKTIKYNEKKVGKLLDKLIEEFHLIYSADQVNNWDGDSDAFSLFEAPVKKILKIK